MLEPTQEEQRYLEASPQMHPEPVKKSAETLHERPTCQSTLHIARPKHPEAQLNIEALATFRGLMHSKLEAAHAKGYGGWQDPAVCTVQSLWDNLRHHSLKANLDMVDVANFAMMVDWRCKHVPGDKERLAAHLARVRQEQEHA